MKFNLLKELIREAETGIILGRRSGKRFREDGLRFIPTGRPKNLEISVKAKIFGIISKKPEVLVKISGFSKGWAAAANNFSYVSRNGKVDLEDQDGNEIHGHQSVKEGLQAWQDFDRGSERKSNVNRRDTMHLVLSLPGDEHDEQLKKAAHNFTQQTFPGHEYILALHTDTKNHHCHVIVKYRDDRNRALRVKKGDLQKWREAFAESLHEEGVEANATPRQVRGRFKRAEKQVFRHIPEERQRRLHRNSEEFDREAVERRNTERRGEVVEYWRTAAEAVERSKFGDAKENRELAQRMRLFAEDMRQTKSQQIASRDDSAER